METLVRKIAEHAREIPDQTAVIFKKDGLTYRELYTRICCAGKLFREMGIRRGDRVMYTSQSKTETVYVHFGIQYAGAAAVPLEKNATPANVLSVAEDTEAAVCLTDRPAGLEDSGLRVESLKQFCQSVENLAADAGSVKAACALTPDAATVETIRTLTADAASDEATSTLTADAATFDADYTLPDPEDLAVMIFTTGTTGRPKGVMLSYRAVDAITRNNIEGIGILPQDRALIPLPLNHSLGLRHLRALLWQGGTVVLQNGFTFAKEMERNIIEKACTGMVIVPASLELTRSQMQENFSRIVGHLRYIEVGAGSLSLRQRRDYTRMLPETQINNTWGSSETGGALFTRVNDIAMDPVRCVTIGKPLSSMEVVALGPDGERLAHTDEEHPGRLALRGGMVMSGYMNRPDATRDALRSGWLVTNDMVYMGSDGYVYMLGRADDIINVGGEKVSPVEVENIASEYEAMRECSCIGVPDPNEVLGQIPVLLVVENEGFSLDELKLYLSSRLERFKLPQAYLSIPALPRNRMKKPDRKEMRRLWDERT